ncbi:MAG TPA: 3-phosphoshikimate 1-carboxyvinyltransferase [Rectinemataceae bacterium]|nr:3-phosphoshikimate 1-carboxyvinyltransferase [Rectinemataceae bacterium]
MRRSVGRSGIGGSSVAPPSKSSMQRAIACASLARGESFLSNPSGSADCRAALGVAHGLGAGFEWKRGGVSIQGARPGLGLATAHRILSCGESGLCMRMFSPIAALFPGETILEAEGSLRRRPLASLEGALEPLGASCRTAEGFAPLSVRGPLLGGAARVDGRESSQFVTGLLIALAAAPSDSRLEVEGMVSGGYLGLTIDTMRAFGAQARSPGGGIFEIAGGQAYSPARFAVEGDWSGAAFLLVAGAVAAAGDPLRVGGLGLGSSQPDRAILDALRAAGAALETGPDWVEVGRSRLEAFKFDATDCPDLFPPLVALASVCEGESLIGGAQRLRHKESDRAAALAETIVRLGASVRVEGDLMRIEGRPRLKACVIDSHGDHRIAMAAAVAALLAEGEVVIDGAECVAKSWPRFFEDLDALRRPPA